MSASLAIRRAECDRMLAKHPNSCPIILASGKSGKCTMLSLSPAATVADIEKAVRDVAICGRNTVTLSVSGCTPSTTTTIGDLYAACKNEDGFLHVVFSGEKRLGDAAALPCFGMGGQPGGDDYDKMMQEATAGLKDQFVQSAHDVVSDQASSALGGIGGGNLGGLGGLGGLNGTSS